MPWFPGGGNAKNSRKEVSLFFVYLIVGIDIGGESVVLPILNRFAIEFGVSLALVGTLFSGTALAMVLSNVWLPMFADRYGRRNAMLISMVGSTVGYFGQATSTSFTMLLVFRVVQGLFGGVPPVAMAYVTDIFTPNERPQYLAMVQATVSFSFVFGAVVGGGLSRFGLRCPLFFSSVVSALGLVFGYVNLLDPRELISQDEQRHIARKESIVSIEESREWGENDLSGYDDVWGIDLTPTIKNKTPAQEGTALVDAVGSPGGSQIQRSTSNTSLTSQGAAANPCMNPRALAIGLVSFLNNVCFCGMSVLLPLYVADPKWGLDLENGAAAQMAGLMFAAVGVCQALVMTSIFHSLKGCMGLLRTCIFGSLLHGLGIMMIPAPSNLGWIWLIIGLAAVGNGICRPSYTIYLSLIASKNHTSQTLALIDVTLNAAMVFGPQLTWIYEHQGAGWAFGLAGLAAVVQSVVVLILELTSTPPPMSRSASVERKALPKEVFIEEIQQLLVKVLEERHFAIELHSAQCIVREILDRAFPFLRPGGPEDRHHMEDVYRLMVALGKNDEAREIKKRFGGFRGLQLRRPGGYADVEEQFRKH